MSIWITILLAIIQAIPGIIQNLPDIIAAIKEIFSLFRKQPPEVKAEATAEVKSALMDCIQDKNHDRLLTRLEALLARLRSR